MTPSSHPKKTRRYTRFMRTDALLEAADCALRTLWAEPKAARPVPEPAQEPPTLCETEQRLSGALMRVNHVGEVCAQAL
jgi:ubiquinone biosynthesis monooxygenase Coq7